MRLKMGHLKHQKIQNLEFLNIKCETYAQLIPLSFPIAKFELKVTVLWSMEKHQLGPLWLETHK